MRGMRRKLPKREYVFIMSLMYHGFRLTCSRQNLKKSRGYLIPATDKEDHDGIDFWVKMPKDMRIFPVQITQRGIRMYKKHRKPSEAELRTFVKHSDVRICAKRKWCKKSRIGFVLVRDFDGGITNKTIAWGDIKALRYALSRLSSLPISRIIPQV
jgi:hypothetical protein